MTCKPHPHPLLRYMHYKMKYYSFPVDSAPSQRTEDGTIRMGCVTEGIDRQEMVGSLQCSGNVS